MTISSVLNRRPLVSLLVSTLVLLQQFSCISSQELSLEAKVEKVFASLDTPTYANLKNFESKRQHICSKYATDDSSIIRNPNVADALSGMKLNMIITKNKFFPYSEEDGIDEDSLIVKLLDELAAPYRANFTWRDSFAVTEGPENDSVTWTQALQLYTEMFDISIDYWDRNSERLNKGVSFLDQWFDGNMILIEKIVPVETNTVNYTNFLKPFTWQVWLISVATIVFSAILYLWIEYMNNQRDDRTLYQWCEDNLYLSSMNFTQQYMYEPVSPAGRIFGLSFAIWSMVMGATYTANLASLFVEEHGGPVKVQDIDDAIRRELKICTWKGTNADTYLQRRYKRAKWIPLVDEIDTYQGLHNGRCDVTVGAMSTWKGFEKDKDYNTYCDLEWVGRTIEEVSSAFAVKTDPARKCTNLIRDVLNYHLSEIKEEGKFDELWEDHYERYKTRDCLNYKPGQDNSTDAKSRRLRSSGCDSMEEQRQLAVTNRKGGGGGGGSAGGRSSGGANPAAAANGEGGDPESSSLSMKAMAGTFVLHAALSGLAILVGLFNHFRRSCGKEAKDNNATQSTAEDSMDIRDLKAPEAPPDHKKVFAGSLASGMTSDSSRGVRSMITHASVQDQLQALHVQQEQLAEQMSMLVSMVAKQQGNSH